MLNSINIFNSGFIKKNPRVLILCLVLTVLLTSTVHAREGKENEVATFSLPSNGEICRKCDSSLPPNVYYANLEEFFSTHDSEKYSKDAIQKSVEELVARETSDIAVFVGSLSEAGEQNWYVEEIKNKLEGLKVLENVFEIHYGPLGKTIVEDAISSTHNICAFNELGNIVSDTADYSMGDGITCKQNSIYDILNSLNQKMASELINVLESPSVISQKFEGKKLCKDEEVSAPKMDQQYCGILKSKRIREAFIEQRSLVYVGNQHQSYDCRQVGLFFQRNKNTNKIEPQPDKSFLVYPNGLRVDLLDDQVREIITEIYRVQRTLK